jgi:pre-mRNA-splicing factor CWC22
LPCSLFTDYFQFDLNYLAHEEAYDKIKADILGEEESEDEASGGEADDGGEESGEEAETPQSTAQGGGVAITDATDTNLINLRRTIYLSIMSSVDFEECAHKLLKVKLPEGQEMELCTMLLECCSQERTYLRFYGLLGQRFCLINKVSLPFA